MKFWITSCLLLPAFLLSAQSANEDLETLRHMKEVLWPQAYRTQDTALLDEILADEFQMIDAEGNWSTKADELAYIKVHATRHNDFHYDIRRLEVLDGHTAVVAGAGHATGRNDKGIYQLHYQSSNVLVKREGK